MAAEAAATAETAAAARRPSPGASFLAPLPTASPTPPIAFSANRPITYVAIGASDAVGVGAANPARDGWVPRLHRRLPAGSRLVNLGVSGARIADAVAEQLPAAIDATPDLVTVWNVVNDLNAAVQIPDYRRDLEAILRTLGTRTTARTLVGNCPDLAAVPAYIAAGIPADVLREEVARWNAAIHQTVASFPGRAYVVDLHARSTEIEIDGTMVAGDDFHPSADAYEQIAEVFWEFMVAYRLVA